MAIPSGDVTPPRCWPIRWIVTVLTSQIQQFIQQLLRRGDDAGVASILCRGRYQIDQTLANVGVGEFLGTGHNAANALLAGVANDRQARVNADRIVVLATLVQTARIGKPRQSNLSQVARDAIRENTADAAVATNQEAG